VHKQTFLLKTGEEIENKKNSAVPYRKYGAAEDSIVRLDIPPCMERRNYETQTARHTPAPARCSRNQRGKQLDTGFTMRRSDRRTGI
jgi:hypothetical protein